MSVYPTIWADGVSLPIAIYANSGNGAPVAHVATPYRQHAAVARRARYCCEYCLAPQLFFNVLLEVDHIVPESSGGETVSTTSRWHVACATRARALRSKRPAPRPESASASSI